MTLLLTDALYVAKYKSAGGTRPTTSGARRISGTDDTVGRRVKSGTILPDSSIGEIVTGR